MTTELLAIVKAEERADALVKAAQEERERLTHEALEDRERILSRIAKPDLNPKKIPEEKPDIAGLKRRAKKNMDRAVKAILEGVRAQA